MNNKLRMLPLLILFILGGALAAGLFNGKKTDNIDTLNIGKNFADFEIPSLGKDTKFSPKLLSGQVIVVNVFASWCVPCNVEHAVLVKLAQKVNIYGVAWKDKPEAVLAYLQKRGNPFVQVGIDETGKTTVPMFLTGVPETFILDKNGAIAFHYKSVINNEIVNTLMLPLIEKLNKPDVKNP